VRALSAGTPRLCIATNSAPLVAASPIIARSVNPLTSLMMSAPSVSARPRGLDVVRVDAEPRPQQRAAVTVDEPPSTVSSRAHS
jgi:hypothetical protein